MIMTPFMKKDGNDSNRVNWIRIIEFSIGSVIIAAITSGINLAVLGEKVESIKCSVSEIKASIKSQDDRIRNVEIKVATLEARRSH
jgi:hypothetical protein